MKSSIRILAAIAVSVAAHGDHHQKPIEGPHPGIWYNTLPGDGGTQVQSTLMADSSPN
jgi:agmatinase